jgi:hypothetical protein
VQSFRTGGPHALDMGDWVLGGHAALLFQHDSNYMGYSG